MALETSQIKFAKSEETGELIGFVSRHSKTKKLKGVRENSIYGKKICVLSEELKGTIIPNQLYNVELKAMHQGNGYVVVSAIRALFKATIDTVLVSNALYQVRISFGNKTIYFDPKDGKSPSSRTIDGVIRALTIRNDIEDTDNVIQEFNTQAKELIDRMKTDGYYIK
ncbi:hypothetical protein CLV62_15224 [Dysgonomonas alginatilytica]|uniref:Uncharacterized protein n=1 Tax=Dysgonomonas alginatilytica TaxID=1605892 RepID=A0A2V3PPE8_9BACT|nr:hypothetical protein [Dysgonomonas alginatilytica]PXV57440.1 hypothetical protein CLV62_15224 [Dysgonomonas alginatilytica]